MAKRRPKRRKAYYKAVNEGQRFAVLLATLAMVLGILQLMTNLVSELFVEDLVGCIVKL